MAIAIVLMLSMARLAIYFHFYFKAQVLVNPPSDSLNCDILEKKKAKRLKRTLEELCCDRQLTRVVLQPVHHLTHVPHHHTWLRHRRLPEHRNVFILEMPKEKKRTDFDPGN